MITFVNDTDAVEVVVDPSGIPPSMLPNYKKGYIFKKDVARISLDKTEAFVLIYVSSGEWYQMTYQFIDPAHNCTNNVELYDFFKTILNS